MEPLESLPLTPDTGTDIDQATEPRPSALRPNRLTSGIVASGAAFAMVLAGLGIASAQTDGNTSDPTPPAATAESAPAPAHDKPAGVGQGHERGPKPGLTAAATALGMTEAELRTEVEAGTSIAAIAAARGVDLQKVIDALVAEAKTRLATAVTEGRITQAQADTRSATLVERITDHVNRVNTPGERDHKGGPGRGPERGHSPVAAAAALGMTEAELRTELEAGTSIAAIADARGVDLQKVIDALVAEANTRLATAVTEGRITQAQADTRSATLVERITDHVNRVKTPGERGHQRGGGADAPVTGPTPEAAPASFSA